MDAFFQLITILAPAGGIGLALAALAVARLRRDPGISIERGKPHELPTDISISW